MIISMNNKNAIYSVAMLHTIWETTHHDTIELYIPMIKKIIHDNYLLNNEIDIELLKAKLSKDFGFENFPPQVIDKILDRLTKKTHNRTLKKAFHKYSLNNDLSNDIRDFDSKKKEAENDIDYVVSELLKYFEENKSNFFHTIDEKKAKDALLLFLEEHGYVTLSDTNKFSDFQYSKGKANYLVGKFIYKAYQSKDKKLFDSILKIASGFMLTKVIDFCDEISFTSELKNVVFYIDTTLLLQLLKYKSDYDNQATKCLYDLIKDKQGITSCFTHNLNEVKSILYYYGHCLETKKKRRMTLEQLDNRKATKADVNVCIASLENNLSKIDIEIIDTPSYNDEDYLGNINVKGLSERLKSKIQAYNDKEQLLQNDIESIQSISRIRKNKKYRNLKDCKAIFVTSNGRLTHEVCKFFKSKKDEIPIIISSIDLATILWLKSKKKKTNLPELELISVARSCIGLNKKGRDSFIDKVKSIESNAGFDREIAEALTVSIYQEKTQEMVAEIIQGDLGKIDSLSVSDIKEIFTKEEKEQKEYIVQQKDARIKELEEKVDRDNRAKQKKIDQKVKCLHWGIIILLYVVTFTIGIVFGVLSLIMELAEKGTFNVFSTLCILFALFGVCDLILSKVRLFARFAKVMSNKFRLYLEKHSD